MTIALKTVTDSISKLAVAGLVIKDMDEVPAEVGTRQPMLIPGYPFVTEVELVRDSTGGGSCAKMTLTYTLNYLFCYKPAGAGRNNTLEYYSPMAEMATAILDAIIAIDTIDGAIDVVPLPLTAIGVVISDPAGAEYIGANIGIRVTEFVN